MQARILEGQILARYGKRGGLRVSLAAVKSMPPHAIMAAWNNLNPEAQQQLGLRSMSEAPEVIRERLVQYLTSHGCLA